MTRKIFAAAVATTAVIVAPLANAKPVNELGQGCVYHQTLSTSQTYIQTFKPTFSVLKKVTFALYIVSTSPADAWYWVRLRNNIGNFLADSSYGLLDANTTLADAARGGTITFAFGNGFGVVPNETYQLELWAYNVPATDTVYACFGNDFYSDGEWIAAAGEYDLEFSATGGGPPK